MDIVITPWFGNDGLSPWDKIVRENASSLRLGNINHKILGEDILVSGLLHELY
jgi:hypothetical protein